MHRNFTKLFYSNINLQLIFIVDVVRVNKPIEVRISRWSKREQVAILSVAVGTMSIQRNLNPINRLPDPSGSLSANLLSASIVSANRNNVEKVTGSARKIHVYVVATNTASHLLLTTASHLNLSMAHGVTSSINARPPHVTCKIISFNLICMKIIQHKYFFKKIY